MDVQVDLNTLQITELTERFDAFEFNLCGTQQLEEEKKLKLNVLRSGECQAIAFWCAVLGAGSRH